MGLDLSSLQGRPGQVGSLVVLEELQGVRSVDLAVESQGQGAGWGRGRRMCMRCVASGTAPEGGKDLPQEGAACQEGGVSDSHQGALIPEVNYYL